MAEQEVGLFSLNAGEISRLGLARVDLAKLRVGCEVESNWLPLVLGPAIMRPGTAYIAEVPGDALGWLGEFYFDATTKALLVLTTAGLQFLVNDAFVTRGSVGTTVTNGTFASSLSGWTDASESGASTAWTSGGAQFTGTGINFAWLDQQVTVAAGDQNHEHALRIVVADGGDIAVKVGTTEGDDLYVDETVPPGTHSFAFTPSGNFWIRLGAVDAFPSYVTNATIEAAGALSLPAPWAQADFGLIRYDQSADVIFVAAGSTTSTIGYQQRKIMRFSPDSHSWGIGVYRSPDGPFRPPNQSGITITPSDVHAQITLTASEKLFKRSTDSPGSHVGSIWQITQPSQAASATLAGVGQFTQPIRVSGLSASATGGASERTFSIAISGTFSATVVLQRSIGAIGAWTDVSGESWTAAVTTTFDDGLNNQIIFYRLGIDATYASGSAVCSLTYSGGVQTGVVRIVSVTNRTTAIADVLSQLGGTAQTLEWAEGEWSNYRGWPAAVALHEGRLSWGTGIDIDLSVSDAFDSFDPNTLGDAGPIGRTVATGGLDGMRWLLSLQRLIAGTAAQEISIRASALDEPLTPTAFVERVCSTRGSAKVRALRIDQQGIFVGRNDQRVYELDWNAQTAYVDYSSRELTRLKQEMNAAGVVDVAVQRQPDTRIWFVLGNGTCTVLTYDKDDEVTAWTPVTTNGLFERVASLPGTTEDDVYFIVNRTINGATKRYIEKLAHRTEAQGGTLSKTVDCHTVYSGAASNTISVPQLPNMQVVVWADGAPLVTESAPITVSAGGIATLPNSYLASNAVIGLAYTAQLKTGKLAYAAERGTALEQQKRLGRVGLVMADVAWQGVRIGRDFNDLGGLPATYKGKALTSGQVLTAYDAMPGSFNGGWDSDSRVCIQVASPYCCTLMALALEMTTNEPDPPAARNGR